MYKTIPITMDDREPSGAVFKALCAMNNVVLSVERLPVGDYLVDDRLLVERKTLNDFALSVIDGRLFRQLTRLAASRYSVALILEGGGQDLARAGIRREALQGALIFVCLVLGVPVLRALDADETAKLLIYAVRQTRLVVEGGVARPGRRPKGKRRRQLYILQGLPGVGPKKAACLLDRFGSIRNIFNAGEEALIEVEGIGRDTARRINWAVGESESSYGSGARFEMAF